MKIVILAVFALIVASLGSAFYQLVKGGDSARFNRALKLRVGLSLALFLFIVVALGLGWISPSRMPPRLG